MLDNIILNDKDILISTLKDYYSKNKQFATGTENVCDVGIIEKVGKDLPNKWEGKIIYYHSNMGTPIHIKNVGQYELLPDSSKLLIRMDQDNNNY